MRRPSGGEFEVYEFKEDDEEVESASARFSSGSVSKLAFLRAFSQDMFDDHASLAGELNESSVHGCLEAGLIRMEGSSPATSIPADDLSDCSHSDELSKETQHSTDSEDEGSWLSSPEHLEKGSPHCPVSLNNWNGSAENEDIDVHVVVPAEYVICGTKLFSESQLVFLPDRIRIHCSETSGNEFVTECEITEINRISCLWSQSVGTTWVKLLLNSNCTSKKVMNEFRSSVLKFCVLDFDWFDKERKIKLLDPRYQTIWITTPEDKFSDEEDEVHCFRPNVSRYYLPDFMETSDEVIYPKGDPDAVSISKRDVDLLQPETFINDTLIDFYIKYLMNNIPEKERPRFYFFNSFFFRKLVDLDKDSLSTAEGRTAFLRVRKWTRKVNIFEKDYLFIPVNYNLHWSLLIICHPGEVAYLKGDPIREACRVPCVLHMDSMKGNHDGLKKLIQSYLWEEWKARNPTSSEDGSMSSIFSSLRFIPLELPQQQNAFDCGFFLLHYVELFLKEAPVNFNPFRITKYSSFLSADWFIPDEASRKRFIVRNLIHELLKGSNQDKPEPSPASSCHPPEEEDEDEEVKREKAQEEEEDVGIEAAAHVNTSLVGCMVPDSLENDDDDADDDDDGDEDYEDGAELQSRKRRRALLEDDDQ